MTLTYKGKAFIPVPRCGSSSLIKTIKQLNGYPIDVKSNHQGILHAGFPYLYRYTGGEHKDIDALMVVRNPYTRVVSAYNRVTSKQGKKFESLDQMLDFVEAGDIESHMAPYSLWLPKLRKIFKSVTLVQIESNDLKDIYGIELRKDNESTPEQTSITKITAVQRKRIAKIYKDDFTHGNYEI